MGKKSVSKQKSVSDKSFPNDLLTYCDVTKVHPGLRIYLGYCLHKVAILYKAKAYPYFAKFKIIGPHFSVLSIINSSDSINQMKICTELGVDKASMVKLIDVLEKNKYIDRLTSKDDRRVKNLKITALGKKVLQQIDLDRAKHEEQFMSSLTADEGQQFKNMLLKLLDNNG